MADTTETIEKHYYTEGGNNNNSALWAALITLLIDEIKAIKAINEQTVSMYQKASENVLKCDNLISELDDVYREKKANDERLAKLEKMMETLLTNFTTPQPTVPVTTLPSIQN